MKKNNTKVELKKYLSQKEKIKNTFISSCIILVVLTFFIFITYSYFIKDSGEINVGATQTAVANSDVKIADIEIVENSNNKKAIITIRNNSNTNTYSYNLNYQDNENSYEIYYDISDIYYSHAKGIIKPFEEKKVYLISKLDCDINDLNLKVDSGYEYSPVKISDGYNEINYYLYATMQHKTELIDLWPDEGLLSPYFETGIYKYDMYIDRNSIESFDGWLNEIHFDTDFSNGGYITGQTVQINNEGTIKHKIKVYADDGTYITTYIINIHVLEFGTGKIKSFKIVDTVNLDGNGNPLVISTAYKENGFENGETVYFSQPDILALPSPGEYYLYYESLDGQDYYVALIHETIGFKSYTDSKNMGAYIYDGSPGNAMIRFTGGLYIWVTDVSDTPLNNQLQKYYIAVS